MKTKRILTIHIIVTYIWLSLCLLTSIYYITSSLLKIISGMLSVIFFLNSVDIARNISSKMDSSKKGYSVLILFFSIAILEICVWSIDQNRLRPSMVFSVFLVSGLGIVALTVITLIILYINRFKESHKSSVIDRKT